MSNKVRGRTWFVDNSSPHLVESSSIGFLYDDDDDDQCIKVNLQFYSLCWKCDRLKLILTHVKKVIDGIKVLKNIIIVGWNI